jgi:hypothetical protein
LARAAPRQLARPGNQAWPARFSLEPGEYGGVESQLATNGSTTFAAVNNLGVQLSDGDYVIVGAANRLSSAQRPLIIAYKLGANGKLPDTVH